MTAACADEGGRGWSGRSNLETVSFIRSVRLTRIPEGRWVSREVAKESNRVAE